MTGDLKKKNQKSEYRFGLLKQVALLFLVSLLVTGIFSWLLTRQLSYKYVKQQIEEASVNIAQEVSALLKENPASEWLMRCWVEHGKDLDIDYDAAFIGESKTLKKVRDLTSRYPDFKLYYASEEEIRELPEEDRLLYAEIVYSWLLTRLNEIKFSQKVDYLFVVSTDYTFLSQYFIFSAADSLLTGSSRGSDYEDYYYLGTTVSLEENPAQEKAMRDAVENSSSLSVSGNYMDYYYYIGASGSRLFLVGVTMKTNQLTNEYTVFSYRLMRMVILEEVVLALFCLLLLYFFMLRPLKSVQKSIRNYTNTKDSRTAFEELSRIRMRNEIGQLSDDVSVMTQEISDYVERVSAITAERERVNAELNLASEIQAGMLPNVFPPFPDNKAFDIYASMDPAKEVGGDFYDFFMTDEDHLVMAIADVSGKGVPAALFMMSSMIMLRNITLSGKGPGETLKAMNDQIIPINKQEMFVTVWLGILDLKTGILTAANAGHEYPFLKEPGGNFELFHDKHNFVVGGMGGLNYREYELKLQPGSRLFVYTDGLPEATDGHQELFGTERILETLRYVGDEHPETIIGLISEAVAAFSEGVDQFDDLTMLCLEYRGDPEKTG